MAELADALDLGSSLNEVGVQVSSVAPNKKHSKRVLFVLIFLQIIFASVIIQKSWARSSDGRAFGSHPRGRGFESLRVHQKRSNFCLPKVTSFFIQAAGLVYHHDAVVDIISPYGAVYHHALACILLRLDEIQHFVLVICNASH